MERRKIDAEIVRLNNAKTEIKASIEGKGITVPPGYRISDYSDLIDQIPVIQPQILETKDVNLIDYDGTLLHSYTAVEFLALTELPEPPVHGGLVSQGWNWTLAEAKTQVQSQGCCDIGCNYIPVNGYTNIYITIHSDELEFGLTIGGNATWKGATIDWGDSEHTILPASPVPPGTAYTYTHTYAIAGDYVITIEVPAAGMVVFGPMSSVTKTMFGPNTADYFTAVKKIHVGHGAYFGKYANIGNCPNLEELSLCKPTSEILVNYDYLAASGEFKGLVFPSGYTTIRKFSSRHLKYFSAPASTTSMIFPSAYSLESLVIPTGCTQAYADAADTLLHEEKFIVPSSVTGPNNQFIRLSTASFTKEIENNSPSVPITGATNNTILEKYKGPITRNNTIPNGLFQNCYNLERLEIVNNGVDITTIGASVFTACFHLTKSNIVGLDWTKITSIGQNAFWQCAFNDKLNVPSLTSLGTGAFQLCRGITEIEDLGSITIVSADAFASCVALTRAILPSTVVTLGDKAFQGDTKLQTVTGIENVVTIGGSTFNGCTMLNLTLGTNITSIGVQAFFNCSSLTGELNLPNLTTLGNNAFMNTSITKILNLGSITTLAGVSTAALGTFSGITTLTEATLPATLTQIQPRVFYECTALDKVTILATTPPALVNADAFFNCPLNDGIYVPAASVDAYKAATNWSNYASKIKPIV